MSVKNIYIYILIIIVIYIGRIGFHEFLIYVTLIANACMN